VLANRGGDGRSIHNSGTAIAHLQRTPSISASAQYVARLVGGFAAGREAHSLVCHDRAKELYVRVVAHHFQYICCGAAREA
jgi:3-deoxy-D-manno-octulosonate 8-phosphate phosphatase KdsC-like HAD superfamily phosphatase